MNAPDRMVLRNRIKDARRASGLTQSRLAEDVAVSRKTINTIENGVFVPSTVLALKIAARLGVTVQELFWLTDDAHDARRLGS